MRCLALRKLTNRPSALHLFFLGPSKDRISQFWLPESLDLTRAMVRQPHHERDWAWAVSAMSLFGYYPYSLAVGYDRRLLANFWRTLATLGLITTWQYMLLEFLE